MRDERSIWAGVSALMALLLLAVAWQVSWFEYETSTGRQTAPDGPYEETYEETEHMSFHTTGTNGDVEPTDGAAATRMQWAAMIGIGIAGLALLGAALGELPGIWRIIDRPVSLILLGVAGGVCFLLPIFAWFWIPEAMAGYGVEGPFTSFLIEPDGYTRTSLWWGWVAMTGALIMTISAGLWKYAAGDVNPNNIEAYAA